MMKYLIPSSHKADFVIIFLVVLLFGAGGATLIGSRSGSPNRGGNPQNYPTDMPLPSGNAPLQLKAYYPPTATPTAPPLSQPFLSETTGIPIASCQTASPVPAAQHVVACILENIKLNGFDQAAHGLYINWRYGTTPLQANFDGSGTPFGQGTNHDPFTDLRYLHNLWLYKTQYPSDTRYDSEIARYTPIVKAEFAGTRDQRGWLFDEEFLDLYNLSKDTFYKDTALGMAAGYAKAIHPAVGIMYKTNAAHPQGYYRPEDVLEAGCALIQAGTLFNNPTWITQGQGVVNFLYAHAYIPQYHTFADQMDQVVTPTGGVNPTETFYLDKFRNYTIYGNQMRMGAISQIILALLHTYQITKNPDFLQKAEDLFTPLSLPNNSLGMWDNTHLGYYASVTFSGQTRQNPGAVTVATGKKEAGRQVLMLWAYHLANQFTNNMYQNMENQMLQVAVTKAYYAPGHGVMYETNPDWTPLSFPNHTPADIVTTEAMGAELEALFSVSRSSMW